MPRQTFEVPSMVGDEDVERVENILRQIAGVRHVEIDASPKYVSMEWDSPATWDDIERHLESMGYPPAR